MSNGETPATASPVSLKTALANSVSRWIMLAPILAFIATLLRCCNPIYTIASGLALLLAGMLIRRCMPPVCPVSWRRVSANVGLCILSLMVGIAFAEILSRVLLRPRPIPGATSMPHPGYLHILRPDSRTEMVVTDREGRTTRAEKVISPQGLRDRIYGPKERDEFRILMLGDSYTLGHAVPLEDTIPKLTEQLLARECLTKKVSVINCGIGGAGPITELGMLIERGLPLKPDLVLYQAFEGNDLADSLVGVRKVLRSYIERDPSDVFFPQDWNMTRFKIELALLRSSRIYREITAITGRKCVASLMNECRLFPEYDFQPPKSLSRPPFQEQNLTEWYPELVEALALFDGHIRDIRTECARHNLEMLAYCMPELATVDDTEWGKLQAESPGGNAYTRRKALRLIGQVFERAGIPHFSVYEILHAQGSTKDTYFELDRHLTARGNALVAEKIRDYLMAEYFPTKDMICTR